MNELDEYYTIPMEIKSETYFGKGLFLFDLAFIAGYWFVLSNFEPILHNAMVMPYTIFNVLVAFILTRKSGRNQGKRLYQSLLFAVLATKKTNYHMKEGRHDDITYQDDEYEAELRREAEGKNNKDGEATKETSGDFIY